MNRCEICDHANVPGTLFCEDCGSGLAADALKHTTGDVSADHAAGDDNVVVIGARLTTGDVATGARLTTGDVAASRAARGAENSFSGARFTTGDVSPGAPVAESAPSQYSADAGETVLSEPFGRPRDAVAADHSASSADHDASSTHMPVAAGMVYLVVDSGRRVNVPEKDVAIVGREDMRSGIRPDVDLTLDGASAAGVSRRHCRLLRQPDGWYIEDLMSTNFTVLNGKALTAHTPVHMQNGDDLRLGKLRLKFHQA